MAVNRERFGEILREEGYGEEVIDYLLNAPTEIVLIDEERLLGLARGATANQRETLERMAKGWRKRHADNA